MVNVQFHVLAILPLEKEPPPIPQSAVWTHTVEKIHSSQLNCAPLPSPF